MPYQGSAIKVAQRYCLISIILIIYSRCFLFSIVEGELLPILVGVFSSLLVLAIVVVFIFVMRRRLRHLRMRDRQEDDTVGLPHRIHLHDDEFNENLDEY